ncbi:MAG: hypothetical protein KOO60_09005 [Gemmatimonadales bacterium]|nr:hypothetical protein [Gemmatimonadales bacterium]
MYQDFEDLRDNCPAEIKAEIAIDYHHSDPARLQEIWDATEDGEFRLYLVQKVTDFWEKAVRAKGGDNVPEDCLAMDIMVDSYHDPEMGYSMYLELHAYCGTEGIGNLCWSVFDDETQAVDFEKLLAAEVPVLLRKGISDSGLRCEVELSEICEL